MKFILAVYISFFCLYHSLYFFYDPLWILSYDPLWILLYVVFQLVEVDHILRSYV